MAQSFTLRQPIYSERPTVSPQFIWSLAKQLFIVMGERNSRATPRRRGRPSLLARAFMVLAAAPPILQMSLRCLAIAARYGTGSGSDRVTGARSLPLPVLYRSASVNDITDPNGIPFAGNFKVNRWRRIINSAL